MENVFQTLNYFYTLAKFQKQQKHSALLWQHPGLMHMLSRQFLPFNCTAAIHEAACYSNQSTQQSELPLPERCPVQTAQKVRPRCSHVQFAFLLLRYLQSMQSMLLLTSIENWMPFYPAQMSRSLITEHILPRPLWHSTRDRLASGDICMAALPLPLLFGREIY